MAYLIPDDLSIPPFLRRGPGNTLPNVRPMSTRGVPVGSPYNPGARLPVPYSPAGMPATTAAPPTFDPMSGLPMSAPGGKSVAPFTLGLNGLTYNGGRDLVPSNSNLPATKDLGSMFSGGLLSRLGSLLGVPGGALTALLSSTSPAGDANDNGQGQLLQQPTFPNGVPLPSPRPPVEDLGNPYAGGMPNVPLPMARPAGAPLSLAPPAPGPSMLNFGGPGSMSFGAGDPSGGIMGGATSGNNYGLGNASALLMKLFGG